MEPSSNATERQQLSVEIEAVIANIEKRGGGGDASFEIEQGRKLIEKAVSLGLPEEAYSGLRDRLAKHDGDAAA